MSKKYRVIIIDSFRRFHECDENSSTEMLPIMNFLIKMRDNGCTVIFLHHRGKDDKQKYRGTEEINAATDVSYSVKREDDQITLECIKNRLHTEENISMRIVWESTISFELIDDPKWKKMTEDAGILKQIIEQFHLKKEVWPTQSDLIVEGKAIGLTKSYVRAVLSKGTKLKYWQQNVGQHNRIFYELPDFQFSDTINTEKTGNLDDQIDRSIDHEENTQEQGYPCKNNSLDKKA